MTKQVNLHADTVAKRFDNKKQGHMPIFNEAKLGEEITRVWGMYGAHAEVFGMMLAERDRLLALQGELVGALETLKDVAAICLRTAPDNDGSRMLFDHIKVARSLLSKVKP